MDIIKKNFNNQKDFLIANDKIINLYNDLIKECNYKIDILKKNIYYYCNLVNDKNFEAQRCHDEIDKYNNLIDYYNYKLKQILNEKLLINKKN